jgi:hypothetical protein
VHLQLDLGGQLGMDGEALADQHAAGDDPAQRAAQGTQCDQRQHSQRRACSGERFADRTAQAIGVGARHSLGKRAEPLAEHEVLIVAVGDLGHAAEVVAHQAHAWINARADSATRSGLRRKLGT